MDKDDLIKKAVYFVNKSQDNIINKEIAISDELVSMKIFEDPIFGFSSAESDDFNRLKDPLIVGGHFLLPKEWMSEAKTVVSFFLPFTEQVRKANKRDMKQPSAEWLHARIEGQAFIDDLCRYIQKELSDKGYKTLVPSLDDRFWSKKSRSQIKDGEKKDYDYKDTVSFTSNWSERHVAFISGLGTFGLSKGLITKKGVAGRFGSLITELELPIDKIEYSDIYENCSMCGACIRNCPANAISMDKGKNHDLCAAFLRKTKEKYNPRLGCGKCQVGVPCEDHIPVSFGRS